MSYISLYRKWRPRTFSEVRGQEAVVTTLKNQVISGHTGHAYLFVGTRGTGKTSVAKILAAAVNCESPKDGNPCLECESCRSLLAGTNINIREIDAASNNGVDNVREINEDVVYPPTMGSYKVYIIDEVHMLSAGAFNALLKTLEEPPGHVMFILATTETHKIPLTIFSRCQRYDFHRISIQDIEAQINHLSQKEGLDIEDKAVSYIAKKADGAMRDALSLLDRCASYYLDQRISYDGVLKILGAVDMDIYSRLFHTIKETDTVGALKILDEAIMSGSIINRFVTDFVGYLRNLLLLTAGGEQDMTDILGATVENVETMKKDASLTDTGELSIYIREMSRLLEDLKHSTGQRTVAEMYFIRLTRPSVDVAQEETAAAALRTRLTSLEKALAETRARMEEMEKNPVAFAAPKISEDVKTEKKEEVKKNEYEPVKALPEDIKKLVKSWDVIVNSFSTQTSIPDMMRRAKPYPVNEEDGHKLKIVVDSESCAKRFNRDCGDGSGMTNLGALHKYIADTCGLDVDIILQLEDKETYNEVQDITELVKIPIVPDDRKEEV